MEAQKLTSILLCALIASTLAHDILRANHFAEEVRASRAISPFEDRATPLQSQDCVYVCTSPNGNTEFELHINVTTNLVGVVNVTAKVGFVLDITANIIALLDGNTGAAIIINLNVQKGNYIAPGESDLTWKADKVSFEVYFNSLTSLKVLLNIGTVFSVQNCPSNILKVIASLLVQLSSSLSIGIQGDSKVALEVLVKLGSRLSVVLTGALNGILQFAGKGVIHIYGDLVWLVGVLEGIGQFLGYISGGLAALIKAKVKLDLSVLLGAANGIEILINLVLVIVAKLDVSVIAGLLNNVENLFEIIVKLGGGLTVGVTGLLKIVLLIIKLVNKTVKLDVLIQALLEFAVYRVQNPNVEIDISVEIDGLVSLVEVIKSSQGSSATELKVFIGIVEQLKGGNLVVGGVNISALIKLLGGVVKSGLQLVVSVLILLDAVVQTVVSLPSLLLALLQCLTTTIGVQILFKLGLITSVGDIIAKILQNLNITTILNLILHGFDLNSVLSSIPIVSDIYAALSAAVKASSNGSLTLSVTLKASGSASVSADIKAWIQSTFHIGGNGQVALPTTKSPGGIFGGFTIGLGGLFG